jgi:hypothetical protein
VTLFGVALRRYVMLPVDRPGIGIAEKGKSAAPRGSLRLCDTTCYHRGLVDQAQLPCNTLQLHAIFLMWEGIASMNYLTTFPPYFGVSEYALTINASV